MDMELPFGGERDQSGRPDSYLNNSNAQSAAINAIGSQVGIVTRRIRHIDEQEDGGDHEEHAAGIEERGVGDVAVHRAR